MWFQPSTLYNSYTTVYKNKEKSELALAILCPIPQDNFTKHKGHYAFENAPDYAGLEFVLSGRIKKGALIQEKYIQLEDVFS